MAGRSSGHFCFMRRYQRNNCNTLCCDVLASDNAETAIDCRVESAWLLAASSLVSASVRLEAPVCSTLIRFLEKSWRICTIDRFEPRFDASVRKVEADALSWLSTPSAELLSRKSVPAASGARLRPAVLKVTPRIASVDLPVSSKVRFSVSPSSRLTPLNEESCEVVSICFRMLLYWVTSPARVACAFGSTTGATPTSPVKAWPAAVEVPVIAPIVDEAALLLVVMEMTPVGSMVACRLLAARAVLSWFSDDTWPAPVPKVMLVAVPPPVEAIDSVLPVSAGELPVAAWVTPPVRPSAVNAAESLEEMLRVPLMVPVCSTTAP